MSKKSVWKWWIVVIVSHDYYTYHDEPVIVQARSGKEAREKLNLSNYRGAATILGPFDQEPQIYKE